MKMTGNNEQSPLMRKRLKARDVTVGQPQSGVDGDQLRTNVVASTADLDAGTSRKRLRSTHEAEFDQALPFLTPSKGSYFLTRIVLVRFLAFIYLIAFIIAFNQNGDLLGRNGLKPANKFMDRVLKNQKLPTNATRSSGEQIWTSDFKTSFDLFRLCPTLFWFFNWTDHIDTLLHVTATLGVAISTAVLITGVANFFVMTALWLLYHSLVNVGQTWYSFGWESQLLESGFIVIFLVPLVSLRSVDAKSPPSFISILLFRWLIVRIMLGAGLIKLRGDKCWRDLTCMNYHYETQPVPNPLSYYMHNEPEAFHKFEVIANHFVELVAPYLILLPFRSLVMLGGFFQIKFQIIIIISGNLSFLNWLTILPSLACFDDHFYAFLFSKKVQSAKWMVLKYDYMRAIPESALNVQLNKKSYIIIAYLSWPVVMNLISSRQAMNTSFEPFRLVNTYGAFGSVTKERHEVIFKGTDSAVVNRNTVWFEYEFNCKPGDPKRRPCVISPYHYRLDWLMWFAAFQNYEQNPWLLSLSAKFLLNDRNFTRRMIAYNPFENKPAPKLVKADLYLYKYSPFNSNTSRWWTRRFARSYIPPISIAHLQDYLIDLGWTKS